MALKKRELTPESGTVDTYAILFQLKSTGITSITSGYASQFLAQPFTESQPLVTCIILAQDRRSHLVKLETLSKLSECS